MARLDLQILAFVFTLFIAQSVSSLKCYVCNSAKDSECTTSPLPERFLKECTEDMEDVAAPTILPPAFHPLDNGDKDSASNRPERDTDDNADHSTPDKSVVFPPTPLPKEATFCRKTSYHIPAQNNGPNSTMKASIRVLRTCGWIPEPKKEGEKPQQSACKWIGTEGVQMDQCVCTGDGCNSGNYLGSLTSQTLILVAVMTAGYFYIL